MTTIFWNGKTLVADSRRTNNGRYEDNATKIVRVENCTYKGEKVLLLAGAGSVALIEAFRSIFTNDPDNFEKVYESAKQVGYPVRQAGATVLVITDKNSYTGYIDTKFGSIHLQKRGAFGENHDFLTFGSGGSACATLVRLFNVPPELAVAAAGIVDKKMSTGGVIISVGVFEGDITYETSTIYNTTGEVIEALKDHLASDEMKYLGVHKSLIVKRLKGSVKEEPEMTERAEQAVRHHVGTTPCVTIDTLVILQDGTTKALKDLAVGDAIKKFKGASRKKPEPRIKRPKKTP